MPSPAGSRFLAAACLCLLASVSPGAVLITEFMAENDGQLRDEENRSPDWIELHNNGANAVNLGGWHLTDDPGDLTKWTFPATNLPSGGHLIVFASGNNRAVAGRELHAGFQLSGDGEYLALVQPDGATIAHSYSPAFPPQRANVSYGVELVSSLTPLISTGATARVLVPVNGSLGETWTAPAFNDTGWLSAITGVGYSPSAGSTNANDLVVLRVDFNDDDSGESGSADTEPEFDTMTLGSNPSSFGGITVTLSLLSGVRLDDRDRPTPVDNPPLFTQDQLYDDFIFVDGQINGNGMRIHLGGLVPEHDYHLTIWSFDSSSLGNRVSDWIETASGANQVITNGYTFNGSTLPVQNGDSTFGGTVRSSASGELQIEGRRNGGTSHGVFLNALELFHSGYGSLITTDIGGAMSNQNASAFIRVPFTVADPSVFQSLRLRMKYDDGFVAYLNGQVVAARNAPASPQWNSAATAPHPNGQAAAYEDIFIVNTPGLLLAGNNVLAIHGLNVSANDADFLILPELEGFIVNEERLSYFSPATPGAPNGPGYAGLVADTGFSVERGFYDAPFSLTLTTATAGAEIYWTSNGSAPSPTNGTLYTAAIAITNTAFVRAAAFLTNYVPGIPVTHSYIFLDQVLQQSDVQPGYPMTWQATYPADYGMDPNVVNHPAYGPTLKDDLRSIPTLSIVADHDSLWHPSTGIYVDATRSGQQWERAASAELFDGSNTTAFQINCGLRMQGAASRDNNRLAKHSFRLLFKSAYGPSKLNYDWFSGPVSQFDNITLRACFTDAWPTRYSDLNSIPGGTGTRYRPEDSLYLRDVWTKDSLADMEHLSGRGEFVHLYVNGLYWGLYNPTERLDSDYFSEHLGGNEQDWDVIRDFSEVLDGDKVAWDQMMALVNAGITNEAAYQAVAQLVDIDNLIDYMLLHIFAEAEDWPGHNWYAARRRDTTGHPYLPGLPATRWIFLAWDQEIVLDQLVPRNRAGVNNNDTPARIYSQLRAWPEFRRLFGDRVQKHLFNDGALTPGNNIARLEARVTQIDRAIVGESARWGDAREFTIGSNPGHGQTFTRDEWWVPELQKMYTNHFPAINAVTIARLRAANLYPALAAPEFSQFGGDVPPGFTLAMSHTNAGGVIYFTTDGSDPRVYGTATIAPAAQAYENPVPINQPVFVRARVFNSGNWSALVEATFTPPQDMNRLVVTEVMYNPPDLGAISGNDLEFLELKNVGTNTLNLSGLTFSTGLTFTFPNNTFLGPGQFFVLARNAGAFATKYPGVTIHGTYTGQLDNSGETFTLSFPGGGNVLSLNYDDQAPWPATPDGHGFSLVPKQPGLTQAPDSGSSWRASAFPGGSPGADDPAPGIPAILVNEVLTHTDLPQRDAVELFNPTGANVDISGWFLTEDSAAPGKYRIPDGTTINAGAYLFFDDSQFNAGGGGNTPFAFSSTGEEVYLFSATTNGQLTGYSHGFVFGAAFNGMSFGRHVNSAGQEEFPAQISPTLGLVNAGPRVGPVIINEIHYHPANIGDDEFVELLNISDATVPLFDPVYPTNTWTFNGLGYTFPMNVTLAPAELLLLVPIDPGIFRVKYDVPAHVQILGPYSGQLDNSGERLTLFAPDAPNAGVPPYVSVEELRYNDKIPWPPSADGGGPSLQRVSALVYGNDPVNWIAAPPTPGLLSPGADSDGDGMPDEWEIAHGTDWKSPDAHVDSDGDGLTNGDEFMAGTHPNDPESVLRIQQIAATPGMVALQFLAASNRTYSVLYSVSPQSLPWVKLADVPADPTNRVATITNVTSGDSTRFYRLVTPQQP